jgi:cation transport regulator
MPYKTNADLPDSIKDNLPAEAQSQFREVVNSVLAEGHSEERAFKSAWSVIKRRWKKNEEGNWVKKNADGTIEADVIAKVDEELGLVFGWAIVSKVNGEDYFDLQGDHIPEQSMLKASVNFMENSRMAKEMHDGEGKGTVLFAFPMTTEIAKSMDIHTTQTGLMIAVKPNDKAMLQKFKDGQYTGFSIGGRRIKDKEVSS